MKPMVWGVDPGEKNSGVVMYDPGRQEIKKYGIVNNEKLLAEFHGAAGWAHDMGMHVLAIEGFQHYGQRIGGSVLRSCWWGGRLVQAWADAGGKWHQIGRPAIKGHLLHIGSGTDADVRRALIAKFEPDLPPRKKPRGKLKGITSHMWAALAVAVVCAEKHLGE